MSPALVVVLLALLLGIQPITTDVYLPALPSLQQDLGASMAQVQMTFAALLPRSRTIATHANTVQ